MQLVLVLHNLLRWAVLIFGLLTVGRALSGIISKRNFTPGDSTTNFWFMISCDIQLLIGLVLYFSGQWFERLKAFHDTMKSPNDRFFSLEHGLMMIVAWIFVHIGRASVKKADSAPSKHKRAMLFFGVSLLIILTSIPWPFREAVMRPLFRWFS